MHGKTWQKLLGVNTMCRENKLIIIFTLLNNFFGPFVMWSWLMVCLSSNISLCRRQQLSSNSYTDILDGKYEVVAGLAGCITALLSNTENNTSFWLRVQHLHIYANTHGTQWFILPRGSFGAETCGRALIKSMSMQTQVKCLHLTSISLAHLCYLAARLIVSLS